MLKRRLQRETLIAQRSDLEMKTKKIPEEVVEATTGGASSREQHSPVACHR
jgi:hypothetical protein